MFTEILSVLQDSPNLFDKPRSARSQYRFAVLPGRDHLFRPAPAALVPLDDLTRTIAGGGGAGGSGGGPGRNRSALADGVHGVEDGSIGREGAEHEAEEAEESEESLTVEHAIAGFRVPSFAVPREEEDAVVLEQILRRVGGVPTIFLVPEVLLHPALGQIADPS